MDNLKTAYYFVNIIWDNEKTNSYLKLNTLMRDVLNLAIKANMDFGINDFKNIYNEMRGGYWFGINSNGKGIGEHFYRLSIDENNTSAIKSFENWNKLKAFILKGKRMCVQFEFYDNELWYFVTGFSKNYEKIYVVAYKRSNERLKGKKQLFNFTNKEWSKVRKSFVPKN